MPRGRRTTKKRKIVEKIEEDEEVEEENEIETEITTTTTSTHSETIKKLAMAKEEIKHEVDSLYPFADAHHVLDDYDCMLNQTNINNNNNKFYIIQLLTDGSSYYMWNRWGRIGENGQKTSKTFGDKKKAITAFEKKFLDKTKNYWESRKEFEPVAGKYTLIEIQSKEVPSETRQVLDVAPVTTVTFESSKLLLITQRLIELIFSSNMFTESLKQMNINVKKMPLGNLSKSQLAKGYVVLEKLENAMETTSVSKLAEISSEFYTLIPHAFGRTRPPTINTKEMLQDKYNMLNVLADIEIAQDLLKKSETIKEEEVLVKPNPLDSKYDSLNCNLNYVAPTQDEASYIKNYCTNTQGFRKCKILHIWKVKRDGEFERADKFDSIENRKLLWHGTSVPVVAAILKTGLRILPHSGGRVGRGIYFASENGKSSGYVGTTNVNSKQIGFMFLNEVLLGSTYELMKDNCGLKAAPKGYDSVHAVGRTEPDSAQDLLIEIDNHEIIVPQGKVKKITKAAQSSFGQSEYLIYKEEQTIIRFLLQCEFCY
ncbi:hypothetical protein SNEBB_001587 [Seison nebaliae]|nr:hypothetical protein SNEBB_001587 [Seison nebaliae]